MASLINAKINDFKINVFVRHEQFNQHGQLIDPLAHKKRKEDIGVSESSAAEDDSEEDSDTDVNPKAEEDLDEEEHLVTNSYKVDFIAENYLNHGEELVLHWGLSKKTPCEWNSPDDRYLPPDSSRFRDGKACQTRFQRDPKSPGLRQLHINFWWREQLEAAVKSMSFVFFEQAKNAWYNNNRQDFHLRFEDPSKKVEGHGDKMEEIVSDIVKCEVVYVREVLG